MVLWYIVVGFFIFGTVGASLFPVSVLQFVYTINKLMIEII